jgi:hypothetical protein
MRKVHVVLSGRRTIPVPYPKRVSVRVVEYRTCGTDYDAVSQVVSDTTYRVESDIVLLAGWLREEFGTVSPHAGECGDVVTHTRRSTFCVRVENNAVHAALCDYLDLV